MIQIEVCVNLTADRLIATLVALLIRICSATLTAHLIVHLLVRHIATVIVLALFHLIIDELLNIICRVQDIEHG